jgi:hypothetical protein
MWRRNGEDDVMAISTKEMNRAGKMKARVMQRTIPLVLLSGAAVVTLAYCGGGSSSPTTQPTPPPTTTTTLPSSGLPVGMVCDPTPPPLYRLQVKMHAFGGNRNVLDSKPVVWNVDHYCDRVGFGNFKFCDTRPEGDLQRVACDYLATGKAGDTGRWGPTWYYNGTPCSKEPPKEGCTTDPDNQFMAVAKGDGEFAACASKDVPMVPDAARCGVCKVVEAKGAGCH